MRNPLQAGIGNLNGDILGSAYEFSNSKGKDFAPLFHPKARFTDHTVCTMAVADALTQGADPQTIMIEWCRRYANNGCWGKRFAEWFMDDNPSPTAAGATVQPCASPPWACWRAPKLRRSAGLTS